MIVPPLYGYCPSRSVRHRPSARIVGAFTSSSRNGRANRAFLKFRNINALKDEKKPRFCHIGSFADMARRVDNHAHRETITRL